MPQPEKTVHISIETWKKLMKIKIDNNLESLNAVIESLIAKGCKK